MTGIKVIFQDDSLLVLDKPAGLVVDSLAKVLQEDFGIKLFRGGIVHRLDKETSGILIVAKTQEALENLQRQFKERKIKKEYIALVHGQIIDGGVVDASIARNPGNREKFTVLIHPPGGLGWHLEGGREAVTEYEPLERLQVTGNRLQEIFADFNKIQFRKLYTIHYTLYTLVACQPKTGRTHQIRVHLKYIGHPIVADEKYVGRKMYRLDHRWCPRMFLHAKRLGFYHPANGKWMELESKLPDDLEKALKRVK